MKTFVQNKYRVFFLAMTFLVLGCVSEPVEQEQASSTIEINHTPIPATDATNLAASAAVTPPPPPAAPIAPAPKDSDYAPPTQMNKEAEKDQAALVTRLHEVPNAVKVKVALLIPLTGESAPLGKSLLDGAILALYDKYSTMSVSEITASIELLPKDTGDTVEGAEKASQEAIQDGATLILGPVFSKQVATASIITKQKRIPLITFSNNLTVAGDGVYLFGFIPEQQVVRIAQYALTQKIANIAALVPSNPYGATIIKQLSNEIKKQGKRLHPVEYYPEDLAGIEKNMQRLARFLEEQQFKSPSLFIAEGNGKLKKIVDALSLQGVKSNQVQLLGTGLWDDTELLQWPALYGGWFASSPPEKYHAFEKHFVDTYGYKPERRASLSYDAVALAATLAISNNGKGFTREMLTDTIGYSGYANGIFRFRDDGSIERALSVLMVTPKGFKTIDPAPESFIQ